MKWFLLIVMVIAFSGGANSADLSQDGLENLPKADVIILGEVHDNGLHHLGQAKTIAALRPKAVVFEMLSPKQAGNVTPKLLADAAQLETVLDWAHTGWPDFALYYPVFAALGNAKIYGAAKPRSEVKRAFKEGAAAVFGQGAARFGLDLGLAEDQLTQRIDEQFAAHCEMMPKGMMGGMVEAQRLRDAVFAATVVQAFADTGGPVVLIAGNGHARKDWGVPLLLALGAPDINVLTLAFLERPDTGPFPFDLWLLTDPAKRDDPCLAFK